MSHIEPSVKITRQEVGVSKHVPITHFNAPTILESKNGALFSVIKFSGVPFDTEKTDIINGAQRALHRAITALDERFCIFGTIHRRKENIELAGEFTNAFAKTVNQAYMAQFKNRAMYVNDLYLAVVYKGLTTGNVGPLRTTF